MFDSAKMPGDEGIVPNVEMSTASGETHLCFPAKVIIFFTGTRLFKFLITLALHHQCIGI